MSKCLIVMVCVSLLVSGCRTPPLEAIDEYVADVVSHPFDVAPAPAAKAGDVRPAVGRTAPATAPKPGDDGPAIDAAAAAGCRGFEPRICRRAPQRSPTTSLEPPRPRSTDSARHRKESSRMTTSFGPPLLRSNGPILAWSRSRRGSLS